MNAMVKAQHIMQVVDWSKYSFEEWLYQFGAWQNTMRGVCGKPLNPIAAAMDQAVVKRKKTKLGVTKQSQIIADVILGDIDFMPNKKQTPKDTICQIDDNEARAVQRLILDMQGKSEVLDNWLYAVIDRYFYFNSWSEMVEQVMNPVGDMIITRTGMDAKFDVKCGLAALHVKYNFIKYEN